MYVSCCVVAIEKGWEFDDQGNVFKPKPAEGNECLCSANAVIIVLYVYSAAVWLNGCGGYYFSNNRII